MPNKTYRVRLTGAERGIVANIGDTTIWRWALARSEILQAIVSEGFMSPFGSRIAPF